MIAQEINDIIITGSIAISISAGAIVWGLFHSPAKSNDVSNKELSK